MSWYLEAYKRTAASVIILTLAVFGCLAMSSTVHAQDVEVDDSYVLPQYEDFEARTAQEQDQSQDTTQTPETQTSVINSGEPNILGSLCAGANLDVTSSCDSNVDESGKNADEAINNLISDIINLFSLVVGVVAVIMIIVGGFRYITSGGDSTNVGNAKNTILYAIIGLVIVALSQTIVRFILSRVTS